MIKENQAEFAPEDIEQRILASTKLIQSQPIKKLSLDLMVKCFADSMRMTADLGTYRDVRKKCS